MERELWPLIYHTLRAAARGTHQKWVQYQPWEIAAVLLWAALHDRSVEWACEGQNWSTTRLRPEEIPSASTMSRRPKKLVFAIFLNRVAALLKGDGKPAWELVVDGKPLPVGRCSKDPDAKGGALGRGYKLHAIWGDDPLPEAWEVTAMREYEGAAAVRLLGRVRGVGFLYGRELRGQPALRRGGRERTSCWPDRTRRTTGAGTATRANTGGRRCGCSPTGWAGSCTGGGVPSSGSSATRDRSTAG
jgi:hypothetical protein